MSGNDHSQKQHHAGGQQNQSTNHASQGNAMDVEKSEPKENWAEIHDKINKQMEEIKQEQRNLGPLVSDKVDLGTLQFEFPENSNFLLKIMKLMKTYRLYRILRRDGSCFYRAFMFRIMEYILLHGPDAALSKQIAEALRKGQEVMLKNGFEKLVVEDFCLATINTLNRVLSGDHNIETLLLTFQDDEESNSMVMYLRFLVSAYIQENREIYACYIDEALTVDMFCRVEVEPLDVEADNIQIMAVFNYFGVPLRIVYLDNSPGENTNDVCFPDGQAADTIWLQLLYRPGHYDLIYTA